MFISALKTEKDHDRIFDSMEEISICKLIKPYMKPRNDVETFFSHPEWRYIIHVKKINGLDSVPYANYLSMRLKFEKRIVNISSLCHRLYQRDI